MGLYLHVCATTGYRQITGVLLHFFSAFSFQIRASFPLSRLPSSPLNDSSFFMSSPSPWEAEKRLRVELSQLRGEQQSPRGSEGREGPRGQGQRMQGEYGRRMGETEGVPELGPEARPRPGHLPTTPSIYCLPSGLGSAWLEGPGEERTNESTQHMLTNIY